MSTAPAPFPTSTPFPSASPTPFPSPFPSPSPILDSCSSSHIFAYIAIPVVFFLSLTGAIAPTFINALLPGKNVLHTAPFRFLHGMAGGFIISVALVHSFPDAEEKLSEANLPEYAWAGMFALVGLVVTWTCEAGIHLYLIHAYKEDSKSYKPSHEHSHDEEHAHAHKHKNSHLHKCKEEKILKSEDSLKRFESDDKTEFDQDLEQGKEHIEEDNHCEHQLEQVVVEKSDRVVSALDYSSLFVLLFGLTFHSVFVGFAIGLQNELSLFIAILMHQLFEGLAIGFHIVHAQIRRKSVLITLVSIFSLSAPFGTSVGLGVQASICHDPQTYNLIAGIFSALAAGILIYVSCVHMIAEEFGKPDVSASPFMAFMLWCGVVFGATIMAALGIWA